MKDVSIFIILSGNFVLLAMASRAGPHGWKRRVITGAYGLLMVFVLTKLILGIEVVVPYSVGFVFFAFTFATMVWAIRSLARRGIWRSPA